jgi:flagellar motor switch protein FliN/FliY
MKNDISVVLGRTSMSDEEITHLGIRSVIALDTDDGLPVEALANGQLIAKGEVVVIDGRYGVKITELTDRPSTN